MGRSYFTCVLLISLVLALCLPQVLGLFGRNSNEGSAAVGAALSSKKIPEKATESILFPDYTEPGSNPRHSTPPPPEGFAP